jgi:acylaminoacyl-peptidase
MYSAAVGDLASPSFVAGTDSAAAKSPMFTLAGDALLFLETKVGGPHCQSARLIALPWPLRPLHEAVPTVLVDHGLLYGSALVGSKCWLDSDTLVIRTQHHSKSVLVEVKLRRTTDAAMDAGGHQVLRTDPGLGVGEGSFNLLAAKDGCIVAVFSNPSTPAVLLLGNTLEDRWTPLSPILSVAVLHRVINLTDGGHGRGEAIVYEPAPTEGEATPPPTSRPLIVWPHGGPHSMTEYGYSAYAAAFVAMGFVVVAPNYVGSAGFGDESILELASGHCGTLDVADVNGSVDAVIAAKLCSPDAVVAFGGSHGGFLSAHLSAQFPSRYKATVIRNPVIDMANMVGSTDIPSWCWTESGLQYSADAVPSADVLGRMHDASPLAWVDQVRAPSLVLIGLKDARVPVSQGFLWHKALRARGIKTEVRTYPDDCHPLSSTKCAADVFVHTVIWMHKCLAGPHGGRSRPATIVWARLADEDTSRLWPARVLPASEHASVRALTRTVQLFGPASRLTDVPHDALVRFAPSLPGHSDLIAEGATAGLAGFDVAVQQAETALALARA